MHCCLVRLLQLGGCGRLCDGMKLAVDCISFAGPLGYSAFATYIHEGSWTVPAANGFATARCGVNGCPPQTVTNVSEAHFGDLLAGL